MKTVVLVWALWVSHPTTGPAVRAYFRSQESCQATAHAIEKKYKTPGFCLPGDYVHTFPQPTERKLS